jgi:glycosyltransferase involved in cell wall biosynthesis
VALADVADVRSFTGAVARLLTNTVERQRLGVAAQRLYEDRFSVERLVSALRVA